MKNKPQKHKSTNTFRYKTFSEHVNTIDIRRTALYHIGHENEEIPEENETHFSQTIRKWIVLNLTEEYHQFSKRCQNIVTLPQLLHKKDFVVDLLMEKLGTATNLSLQPLLEILVAAAKDLREDFYPYFRTVLEKLITLLDTQDAEQLEWTLICLAFLFKTLKPFLRRNIDVVLQCILPILDDTKHAEHVINFAVECFAFVARDIKDYEKLICFIMKNMKNYGDAGIFGMGRLFFEIIRGVNGGFHSVAENFLVFVFESLLNTRYNKILLYEIVEKMVEDMLQFVYPHNMALFWKVICTVTTKSVSEDINNVKAANRLVLLMQKTAEWKDGKFLNELDPIVRTVLGIIDTTEDKDVLMNTSHLVCLILLSSRAKVSQLDTSRLIKKVLSVASRQVLEGFILEICLHPQFEILILSDFLKYVEYYFDHQCLDLMVKVILQKSPMCGNGSKLEEWKQYPLRFKKPESEQKLLDVMNSFDISQTNPESYEKFLLAAIIVPHVVGMNKENMAGIFQKHILDACNILSSKELDDSEKQNYLFFLLVITENVIHLRSNWDTTVYARGLEAVLPFCSSPNYIPALKILDILVSFASNSCSKMLSSDTYTQVREKLSDNLFSSSHEMRLTSAHALSCFRKNKKIETAKVPIYEIFFNVESITPTVHTYRDQLLHLHKLSVESELFKKVVESNELKTDCLKFLLGLLYHNFKLLWEPVIKIIEEYANEYDTATFWDVFKIKLTETADIINGEHPDFSNISTELNCKNKTLNEVFINLTQIPNKVDFIHYRNLLWGCMPNLGKVSEIKNRDIVTLFLKFVNDEYKKGQENFTLTWNISTNDVALDMELEEDENEESREEKPRQQASKDKSTKSTVTTLIVKLGTFTKLVNPKQIHREKELKQLYLELLSSTNSQLQKLALDCIMAYKNNSLTPYKDHLYALVDEKKFKDTLINLKIDRESNTIQAEHRQEFLEILLRILYGKMISKTSNKNMSSQVRKSLVLRFLGGCDKTEILLFLQMSFGIYGEIISNSLPEIPDLVASNFSLENVWSPKKMQSTINTLEMIRKQFGGLMEDDFLEYLLKLVIFVGSVTENVLLNSNKINPKITGVFKNLKSLCFLSLVNFFDHFQNFKWNREQISTIFKVFVWPRLSKLPQESIHSPTPLLKLFYVWSQNPSHFWLLTISESSNPTLTPIYSIVELLLNQKAKPIIRSTIMEIIERLLLTQTETECSLPIVTGVSVVTPHISKILEKLHATLKQRGARRGLGKRDLNILAQLTNLVEDSETCANLLDLLLPILVSKSRTSAGEESVAQVIQTISNLLNKVEKPVKYIRSIAPLFEQMSEVSARKQLCSLLLDISKRSQVEDSKLLESAKIVNELNAWDKRWVEQPDYDKRLGAISLLKRKLDDDDVDIDLGLLVIYNCFYFMKYDKDMGLRDNASEFLRVLIPKLVARYKGSRKEIDYLVGDVVLNLVRRTIRDKNETVRNEGVQLFGEMIRECPVAHPILQDLELLTNKIDREVDFFDNITHLQSHRHGRALLKFCSVAKTLNKAPSPRTLTQFLLPLATRYLLNEKFAPKHTLIDASIETIGVVCKLLPWHHYHAILKFYLGKMKHHHEYQKQLVRIVVVILDAFHFDLTGSKTDLSEQENQTNIESIKIKELLKKKENQDGEEENVEKESPSESKDEIKLEDDDLDCELDELNDDSNEAVQLELAVKSQLPQEPVYNHITRLSPSNAKAVVQVISEILIPTLNHSITSISSYDTKHKVNRRKRSMEREEEEILRVPIALALVKLLQKLPNDMFETSLPGVFMKVCTFLKSPLKSVRMCTRDILKKIMSTLGSRYLSVLVDKLTSLLTRGFQVHVLSVTIHGVLDCLQEKFKPGDLETCLQNILEVTLNDIFGDIAAEKEIEKIAAHTPEAKPSAKSYLTLHIIARNIQESCLVDLLIPFKEHLAKSQSRKVVSKIQDCFQKIVTGLVENKNISQESLLIFIYGILSESITELLPGKAKPVLTETEKERMRRARPDCFIIPEEPRSRSGAVRKTVKTNTQANAHVLIELGLEMLHIILKRKKIIEETYEPFLNPLVPLLKDSLKSSHIRVTTFAIKCVASIWNGEYKLQAVVDIVEELVELIFTVLHKYTSFGITKKDDNFHLVKSAFKAVVALLRKCEYYTMKQDYIAQLVLYIEQDVHESDKLPMAFSLLKALVNRKVICPEIHDIMKKLSDLAIISESNYARDEARNILIIYVMEYPLQKKVDSILKFFTTQLNFSVPSGRLSAIKFLHMVVKRFPEKVLTKKSEFLFLSLGTRLVNEEVPECRVATAECIEQLISRLDDAQKQKLFEINLLFLNGDKPAVREMAATLFSRFVVQEKETFFPKAKTVLPVLVNRLFLNNPKAPGRFVKAFLENGNDERDDLDEMDEATNELREQQKQRAIDHELIQLQNCIFKIIENCPQTLEDDSLVSTIDELAYESQRLLAYDHEWVRFNAAKILEKILATFDFEAVSRILLEEQKPNGSKRDFIYLNPESDLKSLTLDLCAQMIPGVTNEPTAEQVVKVLLYIANILKSVLPNFVESDEETVPKINLNWLLRRIRYIVHGEVAKASHSCVLRTAIFNWIEGLIALLDTQTLEKVSHQLLTILIREMSEDDQNIDPKLRQQAIRLGSKIRKRIGDESYNKLRTNIQNKLMMKRADRRKQLAQEKVNDPIRAAKRKHGQQERKKLAKRRKTDVMRGKIAGKKRKRKLEDDDLFC